VTIKQAPNILCRANALPNINADKITTNITLICSNAATLATMPYLSASRPNNEAQAEKIPDKRIKIPDRQQHRSNRWPFRFCVTRVVVTNATVIITARVVAAKAGLIVSKPIFENITTSAAENAESNA